MMRSIKYIVVHCSATTQDAKVESIKRYWKEKMGWRNPGYHYIIDKDGNETQLLTIAQPSNGVKGYNNHSIHVCYIGGIDKQGHPQDNRTPAQKEQLLKRISALKRMFVDATILGHRDFDGVKKACPSFDAREEYKHL